VPTAKKSSSVAKSSTARTSRADKQRIEFDRANALAKLATRNAKREDTKTPIPFGAAVTTPQILVVEKLLASRDILKFLACSEKQLRAFSRNEISFSMLPAKTQQQLRVLAKYSKPWARKTATICYILLLDRKKRARKPAAKKPEQSTTTTPAETASA
jgi:hypothetical protein